MIELPDFHIPHVEKIEWMIETTGWAYESVPPKVEADPPTPSYGYTIGLGDLVEYPEIVLFGLTPSAGHGLLKMVVDLLVGGTELPIGPELLGVLDNDLRCCFAPLDDGAVRRWMPVSVAWHEGQVPTGVQLMYPDRSGYLPYEAGFDHRLRYAQPIVGSVEGFDGSQA